MITGQDPYHDYDLYLLQDPFKADSCSQLGHALRSRVRSSDDWLARVKHVRALMSYALSSGAPVNVGRFSANHGQTAQDLP